MDFVKLVVKLMISTTDHTLNKLLVISGIAANVKLLLKLIQDHNDPCNKDDGDRKSHRVAGMITIIDDVKSRIEKSQAPLVKRAQLRRCNTELRRTPIQNKDRKSQESIQEENERLRRELTMTVASRKSLERMFSSLGKEKEMIAAELALKVHELSDMEEHLNDLKAQNEKLLAKVQACAAEHKDSMVLKVEVPDIKPLQERNNVLSEQLLRSMEGCRVLKRSLREMQEENSEIKTKMSKIGREVEVGLDRIHDLRRRVTRAGERTVRSVDIEEQLSYLECLFQHFEGKVEMGALERGE